MSEANKPKRAKYQELVDALRAVRKDIDELVANSQGVAGLHMNGAVADWDSLLPGGEFGAWLGSIDYADGILERADIALDPQPTPLTADALADALECFWNAAITAAHNTRDPVAMPVASVMTEGFAAVAYRLRENGNG